MKKNRIVYTIIVMFMAAAIILAVPVGIFRLEHISHNGSEAFEKTPDLKDGLKVIQYFIPEKDYIRSISVDLDRKSGEAAEGELYFVLRDANGKGIASHKYSLDMVADGRFFEIPIKRTVRAGNMYSWEVYVSEAGACAPCLYCTSAGTASPSENQKMLIGNEQSESTAVTMYNYAARQGKVAALTYISFILWVGTSLMDFWKSLNTNRAD